MMWQLKPCMSQEFPPILQIFHCPVSLSPLHAVILLLCMCAHTDDTVLIGVRAHLEVFVERCVSQLQSEHRCEFVVVWIFEVDLDDHAASRLSSADGSFSPRSSRGVSEVWFTWEVFWNPWKYLPVSWCGSNCWLLFVCCCCCRWFLCCLSQTESQKWVVSQTLKQKSPLQLQLEGFNRRLCSYVIHNLIYETFYSWETWKSILYVLLTVFMDLWSEEKRYPEFCQ